MSVTMLLFYTVFLAQIYLISYHYPMQLRRRILQVVKRYPPSDYPKLYPKPYDFYAEQAGKKGLTLFRNINFSILAIGLAILALAANSGYSPSLKGGDEIFVLMYFMLQVTPLIFVSIASSKHYKRMREMQTSSKRKADMQPRHLSDFIAPAYLVGAVLMFAVWLGIYLFDQGFSTPWSGEVYGTVFGITGIYIIYALVIGKHMVGKKIDPHQASEDRTKMIGLVVKSLVFSSMMMNAFMIVTILADRYSLELYDPVFTSLFVQAVSLMGIGFMLRSVKIEAIDFDVYKDDELVANHK